VNISAFVTAFEATNAQEVERAKSIYFPLARVPEKEGMATLYEILKPAAATTLAKDTRDLAADLRVTEAGACQWLSDNSRAVLESLRFDRIHPIPHGVLMGVR
jgi:hypothetical protein